MTQKIIVAGVIFLLFVVAVIIYRNKDVADVVVPNADTEEEVLLEDEDLGEDEVEVEVEDSQNSDNNPPSVTSPVPILDPKPVLGACYVGGCSSQVCSDSPDVMTTCEWREEYACYRTAKCERQESGQCGWTQTEELLACVGTARGGGDLRIEM